MKKDHNDMDHNEKGHDHEILIILVGGDICLGKSGWGFPIWQIKVSQSTISSNLRTFVSLDIIDAALDSWVVPYSVML